jgi:hypothetical protein
MVATLVLELLVVVAADIDAKMKIPTTMMVKWTLMVKVALLHHHPRRQVESVVLGF